MAHFVTCSRPVYAGNQSNDSINLDFCKKISKSDLVHNRAFAIIFHWCNTEWLFECKDARNSEYDRIGKEQSRR